MSWGTVANIPGPQDNAYWLSGKISFMPANHLGGEWTDGTRRAVWPNYYRTETDC